MKICLQMVWHSCHWEVAVCTPSLWTRPKLSDRLTNEFGSNGATGLLRLCHKSKVVFFLFCFVLFFARWFLPGSLEHSHWSPKSLLGSATTERMPFYKEAQAGLRRKTPQEVPRLRGERERYVLHKPLSPASYCFSPSYWLTGPLGRPRGRSASRSLPESLTLRNGDWL